MLARLVKMVDLWWADALDHIPDSKVVCAFSIVFRTSSGDEVSTLGTEPQVMNQRITIEGAHVANSSVVAGLRTGILEVMRLFQATKSA